MSILILLAIGYTVTTQLRLATQSAAQLLAAEVVEKIEINVIHAYRELKRFPNADNEFETLVLHKLDLLHYPARMAIQHFTPGNPGSPATFQVSIKAKTIPGLVVKLVYYGSEYRENPLLIGKLLRR